MKNFTTVAEVYDPRQPIGQRWTTVGDTQIPRLYHSVAFLTPNAEVKTALASLVAAVATVHNFCIILCTESYRFERRQAPRAPFHVSLWLLPTCGCYQSINVNYLQLAYNNNN